jgi:GNAT superfamily N-acetyltransferase
MPFEVEWRSFPSPDGPLRFARIPWDSETFQHPVYELRCSELDTPALCRHLPGLLNTLSQERPVLVWAKLPVNAVEQSAALAGHGFYPVETLLELHLALDRFQPVVSRAPAGLRLRPATDADLPRLRTLARSAFRTDRYHVDPNFFDERADERFVHWIERGMQAAEPVFVYEDQVKGNTLGFYHIRETAAEPKTIYLSLAAIDAAYQRLGLGLLLYQAVLLECKSRGYVVAETHISAYNLDVLNVFARLGCSFRNPTQTLHWFGSKDAGR